MPMQVMYKVHANQHTGWGQAGVSEHLVGAHLPSPFIGLTICSLSGWLEGGPMGAFPRGIHFMVCHHLGEARQMHPDKANLSSSSGSWLGADLSVT